MSSHECTYCDEEFGSYQALNAHCQVHDTHKELECRECGDTFEVPESQTSWRKTCSRECMGKDQSKRFSGLGNPNANTDVSNDDIRSLYEDGFDHRQVAERVNLSPHAVLNRLRNMDVELRQNTFGHEQETSFGLKVRSGNEAITAEWLDRFGPENWEYEPRFPGRYTPDFVLGDGTVMEVWGMDTDKYMTQKKKKQQWYSNEGYELINVESQDINDMKQMMEVA